MSTYTQKMIKEMKQRLYESRQERINNSHPVTVYYGDKIDYASVLEWTEHSMVNVVHAELDDQARSFTIYFAEEEDAVYFDKIKDTLLLDYDLEGERSKYESTVELSTPVSECKKPLEWLREQGVRARILKHEIVGKGLSMCELEVGFNDKREASRFKLTWG